MKQYIIFEEILSNTILGIVGFISCLFAQYITGSVNLTICVLVGLSVFTLLSIADFSKRYIDKNY